MAAFGEAFAVGHRAPFHQRLHAPPGDFQAVAHAAQHHPVGFVAGAGARQQLVAGAVHGQVGEQVLHVTQVEVGGHPASQQQDFAGDGGGDVGVTVAVAAHPGGEADRHPVRGQGVDAGLAQLRFDVAHYSGHRFPQRLFDHREAPLGFVHRGGPLAADFVGGPGGQNQLAQALAQAVVLFGVDVRAVQLGEQIGHLVVLADQGAPGHLGGMGGEHQLHGQRREGLADALRLDALLLQLRQHLAQALVGVRVAGVTLVAAVQTLAVMLLGDVGQVEKLAERPRYFQQRIVVQRIEQTAQAGQFHFPFRAAFHRRLADGFHGVVQSLTGLLAEYRPQLFAQQAYIVAQRRVLILFHRHLHSRYRFYNFTPDCIFIPSGR